MPICMVMSFITLFMPQIHLSDLRKSGTYKASSISLSIMFLD